MKSLRHLCVSVLSAAFAAVFTNIAAPSSIAATTSSSCAGDCVPIGKWDISIGLGYGSRSNPVVGQDTIEYFLVPQFSYYGKRFFLDNYDLGYTLVDSGSHQFNALIYTPGFEQIFFNSKSIRRYDVNTSAQAPPMDSSGNPIDRQEELNLRERHTAGFSGLEYTYIGDSLDWQIQFLQDVTRTHNGQKIRSAVTYPWRGNKQTLSLSAGLTWQSEKLVDYYYGISASETNVPELRYNASASTAFHISGEWEKYFNRHWSIRGVGSYRWLGKAVTDSPIVEDDAVSTFYFAGVYHF